MKKWFVLLSVCVTAALAAIPRFAGPTFVNDGANPIDLPWYGSPCVADWDRDGKKDILTGANGLSNIRFYRNVGTDAAPLFNGFTNMRAGGATIFLSSG